MKLLKRLVCWFKGHKFITTSHISWVDGPDSYLYNCKECNKEKRVNFTSEDEVLFEHVLENSEPSPLRNER